jgi:hypothetical protein
MDTVQQLRRRAQAAGNLQSNEQMQVQQQGQTIVLQPAAPQVLYVPYYDPYLVYGPWWWPAYQPVVWAPWPGYARPYHPGVSIGFWWGQPVSLSLNFFFGNFDWHHRHVRVVHPAAYYYRPPVVVNRTVVVDRARWQHDPHHRRHVAYRAPEVRQRFASAPVERRDVQREERRAVQPQPQAQTRPAAPAQARPFAQPQVQRDQSRQQAEAVRAQQQRQREQAEVSRAQQRQQADAARFQQQQRQRAEASRAQQRQQADTARFQQQQRQRAEASRAQQQQQRQAQRAAMPAAKAPQAPRIERQAQREERQPERRQERGHKG